MTIRYRPIAFEIAEPFLEKIAVSFGGMGSEGFFRALQSVASRKNLSKSLIQQDNQLNNLKVALKEGTLPRSSPIYEMLPPDLQQVQSRQMVDDYLLQNINKELKSVNDQKKILSSFETELKNVGPTPRQKRRYEYSLEAQRRAEKARRPLTLPSRRLRAERASFPEIHPRAPVPGQDYRQLERDLPLGTRLSRATGYGKTLPEIADEPMRRDYLSQLRAADDIRGGRDLSPEEISRFTDRIPEVPFDPDTGRNLLRYQEMPRQTRQPPQEFDRDQLAALYQREQADLAAARNRYAQYDADGTLISRSLPEDSFLSNQAFRKEKRPDLFFDPQSGGAIPTSNQRIAGSANNSTLPPARRRKRRKSDPTIEPTWSGAGFTDPVPLHSQHTATVRLEPTATNAAPPFVPLDNMLASNTNPQSLRTVGQTGGINNKFKFTGKMSQGTDPLKTFTGIRMKRS